MRLRKTLVCIWLTLSKIQVILGLVEAENSYELYKSEYWKNLSVKQNMAFKNPNLHEIEF